MGYSGVKGNAEVYEDLEIVRNSDVYGNFDIMRKFVVTKHS